MRSALTDVLGRLEEARATKDVVKLNCVNEKLTQVKGLLRISEQSDVALQEAVAKRDGTAPSTSTRRSASRRTRSSSSATEAEQCIGQLAFRTDENLTVEVEVPSGLPRGPDESAAAGAADEPASAGEPDSLVDGRGPLSPVASTRVLERPRACMV